MSIDNLFTELTKYSNPMTLHPKWLMRGQSNVEWQLQPSLARILNDRALTRQQGIQVEREGINKFSISARTILPIESTATLLPTNDTVDFLGWSHLMQHYSAPTRLLDWSASPWVALFFACFESEHSDGAVWVADYEKAVTKAELELNGRPFQETLIDPNAREIVHFSVALNSNERIEAQQGRFSISSNPLSEHSSFYAGTNILTKLTVDAALKNECLIRLNAMNINAKTLFPGADGLGKSVQHFYKLWDKNSRIV
jgi:hypothetical protein